MAYMKPEVDPSTIPHDSEQVVYVALRDQLPDDYVVLHSYPWLRPDRDGHLREGETDFVILHERRGILVLEVKGGELDYKRGCWMRKKSRGWEKITDPFVQARKNMHALLDEVEQRSSRDVTRDDLAYGYAVVFPHHVYTGPEPPGADPAIILTQPQMPAIRAAIENAFEKWPQRKQPLGPLRWGRLLQAVLPKFYLYRPVAADLDSTYRRIVELTDEQQDAFRGLYDENLRVFVPGVAGSGKTMLALDRALCFAKSGRRTLMVCFNKQLAEHLEDLVASSPQDRLYLEEQRLCIRNFHRLARELIVKAGLDFDVPDGGEAEAEFWTSSVPDLLEQAITLLLDGGPVLFDAIVIDEGQDLHPRWWECLNYSLLSNLGKGAFYAFADPDQSLWDWSLKTPPVSFQTTYRRSRNCRNTRLIARSSARLAAVETRTLDRLPVGIEPTISILSLPSSMKGIVQATVTRLLKEHHLQPSQTVLIGTAPWSAGALSGVAEIEGVPITDSVTAWKEGGRLLVTTARKFKGLEADAVVLYDLQDFTPWFRKSDLYVACTRGRSYLHCIATNRELAQLIETAFRTVRQEFVSGLGG